MEITNLEQMEQRICPVNGTEFVPFELITSDVCIAGSVYGPCSTCVFKELYYIKPNFSEMPQQGVNVNSLYCLHNGVKFDRYNDWLIHSSYSQYPHNITSQEFNKIRLQAEIQRLLIQTQWENQLNNYKLFKKRIACSKLI